MTRNSPDTTILVQSSNIDLGSTFRDYARQNITRVAGKYFGHLNGASVHVSRDGEMYRCTVNIRMGALKAMSAEAQHRDCYGAFKNALERVEKQLRRAKRELRDNKAAQTHKDMLLRGSQWGGAFA